MWGGGHIASGQAQAALLLAARTRCFLVPTAVHFSLRRGCRLGKHCRTPPPPAMGSVSDPTAAGLLVISYASAYRWLSSIPGLSWTHLPINRWSLDLISVRAKFQHTIMTTNHWGHHPTFRAVSLQWVEEEMCISSYDHKREGAAGVPHTRTRKAAYRWRLGAGALPYTLSHGPEPPMTRWFPPSSHETGA